MKSVLITGASGFLGSHLCEWFLKKNNPVIAIDNYCTGSAENTLYLKKLSHDLNTPFYFFQADICAPWSFLQQIDPEILQSLHSIFHFASPASPQHYQRLALETMWANTLGLAHAIHCGDSNSCPVIFASSSEVYGDAQQLPQSENYWGHVNPFGERSCYDESKRFGEALIYSTNKKNHTTHGLVRLFNSYGPRMNPNDGRVLQQFILHALKNTPLTIYGTGQQTRSFCYVDDTISGITSYAHSSFREPMNIGNDTEISVLELAHLVRKILNSNSKIIFSDLPSDDPQHRRPNLQLAKKILPEWQIRIDLEQGILKMAESILKQI